MHSASAFIPNHAKASTQRGRRHRPNVLGRTLERRLRTCVEVYGGRPNDRRAVWECTRQAIRDLLPLEQRAGHGVTPALITQIADRTRHHLATLELYDGESDDERDRHVSWAITWAMKTYDPERAGAELWFEAADIIATRDKLNGMISAADQSTLRAELAARGIHFDRPQLIYVMGLVWCAAAKNILASKTGALPVASIEGMLRKFNVKDYHLRSLVRIALEMLERVGAIRCTHRTYGPRFCRRYAVAGATYRLKTTGHHQQRGQGPTPR